MTASRADRPEPLSVAGHEIRAGRRARFEVPVARLPAGGEVALPMAVVHGRRPGPRVWLSAAIHGDEINGVEIIRRVLADLRPRDMAGAVIAAPIVNVFGFIAQSRYLPDRRDLNRCFPGSAKGSLAARLAHLFMEEVVARCAYVVDLHTGAGPRRNLPQVRCNLDDEESRRPALAFGAPVVIHAPLRDGSLRAAAGSAGAHVLAYEGGEALRFNSEPIRVGVLGVRAVLRHLGVLPPEDAETPAAPPLVCRRTRWTRAGRSGIFHPDVRLGDAVEEGQRVGRVADPLGSRGAAVRAPIAGVIIGRTNSPLVHRGDALFNIAGA